MCIYYNLTLKKIYVKLKKIKFKKTSSAITSGDLSLALMCYFHVTSNVIKNFSKYNVPVDKRKQVNKDIYFIHESRNQQEYSMRVSLLMDEWSKRGLIEFRDYFYAQWLTPPFDTW